jgi:hypothetical protein
MFTESENIMEKIDQNDWLNSKIIQNQMEDTQRII